MKVMIDISEELLNHILDSKETLAEVNELVKRVVNGKVFPTNTTNGDMLQDIFPNCVVKDKEMSRADFGGAMGAVFENLTEEESCELMCGGPEDEWEDDDYENKTLYQIKLLEENKNG